jgi:hypothetical protein
MSNYKGSDYNFASTDSLPVSQDFLADFAEKTIVSLETALDQVPDNLPDFASKLIKNLDYFLSREAEIWESVLAETESAAKTRGRESRARALIASRVAEIHAFRAKGHRG